MLAERPCMPSDDGADGSGRARLLALLLAGVLVPGLARWWLGSRGYDRLGVAVFVGGYALAVGLAWRYWLGGVAVTGPDG